MSVSPQSAFTVRHLGLQPYSEIWQRMQDFTATRDEQTADELWVLQHLPVFTLGQAGKAEHILKAGDIPVLRTDRGGQVTYHGPGQLVIYLLSDVRRSRLGVRQLVDAIEQSIVRVLQDYGISGVTRERAPGVYVGDSKIAALGLRIRRGCSYHGLSLNIDMDLEPFSRINPCGYEGLACTQIRDLSGDDRPQLFAEVESKLIQELLQKLAYN